MTLHTRLFTMAVDWQHSGWAKMYTDRSMPLPFSQIDNKITSNYSHITCSQFLLQNCSCFVAWCHYIAITHLFQAVTENAAVSTCITLTYVSLLSALKVFLTYGAVIILISNNNNRWSPLYCLKLCHIANSHVYYSQRLVGADIPVCIINLA